MSTELEKIAANREDSQKIGEFLEWLSEQGYSICDLVEDVECEDEDCGIVSDQWLSIPKGKEEVLSNYFGIDLKKAEEERCALLESIRAANDGG